jgi:hypothetical protein
VLRVEVDQASLQAMTKSLGEFAHQLPRHLATAVNRVSKSVRADAAKRVGKIANIGLHNSNVGNSKPIQKAKTLKKAIRQKGKATPEKARVIINLWDGFPFPVKYHSAQGYTARRGGKVTRQGVRYKTHAGGGWTSILDGFIVARFGGNAYTGIPGARKLIKVLGKRPGDYFAEGGVPAAAAQVAAERLPVEIKRRIRELNLAREGKITLRASKGLGR